MSRGIKDVSVGHITDKNGDKVERFSVEFIVKLIEIEKDWKEKIKLLLSEARESNQGTITEKVFARRKKTTTSLQRDEVWFAL
jgi:hypothetical protein